MNPKNGAVVYGMACHIRRLSTEKAVRLSRAFLQPETRWLEWLDSISSADNELVKVLRALEFNPADMEELSDELYRAIWDEMLRWVTCTDQGFRAAFREPYLAALPADSWRRLVWQLLDEILSRLPQWDIPVGLWGSTESDDPYEHLAPQVEGLT